MSDIEMFNRRPIDTVATYVIAIGLSCRITTGFENPLDKLALVLFGICCAGWLLEILWAVRLYTKSMVNRGY